MNVLIPIAGQDNFFPREDYHFPKPLVEVDGSPMIEHVVGNLRAMNPDARFIFVVKAEDCISFSLDRTLRLLAGDDAIVVKLQNPTAGAVCSCLMAVEFIDNDEPLVIANGDQVIGENLAEIVRMFTNSKQDGGVITFDSVHPRWSYVRVGKDGHLEEAAEKRVISREAIAGFYFFRRGADFVRAAEASIMSGASVNGLYYIAPALNQIILAGKKLVRRQINAKNYHSLYSPQRIDHYQSTLQNREIRDTSPGHASPGGPVTIVIPMAGEGRRFAEAGYDKPKPFIDVAGKPMIQHVMENLRLENARYILIGRREHFDAEPESVSRFIKRGNVELVYVNGPTEGTACTLLLARRLIDNDAPLLIANSDQLVDFRCEDFVADAAERGIDGSILVFRDDARDPKWSFARLADDGLVAEVAEKKPISDLATVGIYYFARGRSFVASAIDMIARNVRVNNEFYTCPTYNYAIESGLKIGVFEVPATSMHGLGTPADLKTYLKLLQAGR